MSRHTHKTALFSRSPLATAVAAAFVGSLLIHPAFAAEEAAAAEPTTNKGVSGLNG